MLERHFRYQDSLPDQKFLFEIFSFCFFSEVAMEVLSSSTLNPNAPLFVPLAYRTVEDFSDQWWALVQSSPWFRDYWLEECFQDPEADAQFNDIGDPALPEIDALFADCTGSEVEEVKEHQKELVSLGSLKWRKTRDPVMTPRHFEKAPKIVSMKVSPRPIQQPR